MTSVLDCFGMNPANSTLEMMSEVARKILSKDPAAEAERNKKAEEAKTAGGQYHGKSNKADAKVNRGGGVQGLAPAYIIT